MSAIEDSLRRALANGNVQDPAFRESIYAASERALERMIAARALDPAAADDQRRKLIGAIERIEAEQAGAPGPVAADPGAPPPPFEDMPDAVRPPASFAPPPPEPSSQAEAEDWRPQAKTPSARRPRRGLLLIVLPLVILLAIVLYIVTSVFQTGEVATTPEPSAPAADSAATTDAPPAETAAASSDQPPELNWISVFSGGELEALTAPAGGRVEAVEAEGRTMVRISGQGGAAATAAPAPTGEDLPEIALALGPGLVSEISGSEVRVEIRAGSPDGALREFSVRCQFGSESVCDRQRFATMMSEEAFVFDVEIPAGAQAPASLAIAPGIGAEGADLDLYSVRMRVL